MVMFLNDGIGGNKSCSKALESRSYIRNSWINLGVLIAIVRLCKIFGWVISGICLLEKYTSLMRE